QDVELDVPVLLFTTGLTLLAAVLCGLAPVVGSDRGQTGVRRLGPSRRDLSSSLHEGARETTTAGTLRSLLVVTEVTLAMTLVVAAALLVQSFISLQHVDLGFRHERLLTAS